MDKGYRGIWAAECYIGQRLRGSKGRMSKPAGRRLQQHLGHQQRQARAFARASPTPTAAAHIDL